MRSWELECLAVHRQAEAYRTFGCRVSGSLSVERLDDKLKRIEHSLSQKIGCAPTRYRWVVLTNDPRNLIDCRERAKARVIQYRRKRAPSYLGMNEKLSRFCRLKLRYHQREASGVLCVFAFSWRRGQPRAAYRREALLHS